MQIIWIGFHEEGILAFKNVLESGTKISCFITLNDESYEKRSAGSRTYIQLCHSFRVPVHKVPTIKNTESFEIIKEYHPDLIVVLGWSEIIPKTILDLPTIGTVGAHAALLPHNRGCAPVNWAIINGEKITGNTLMWLNPEVDSGTIISQQVIPITLFDTCKTIYDKVGQSNSEMIIELIQSLNNNKKPILAIPNETEEALLPRRRPNDGIINWNQSCLTIYNFIRALTKPYPGAFSFLDNKKIGIWSASVIPMDSCSFNLPPGQIFHKPVIGFNGLCGYIVGTTTDLLLVSEISCDNKYYSGQTLIEKNLRGTFKNE